MASERTIGVWVRHGGRWYGLSLSDRHRNRRSPQNSQKDDDDRSRVAGRQYSLLPWRSRRQEYRLPRLVDGKGRDIVYAPASKGLDQRRIAPLTGRKNA